MKRTLPYLLLTGALLACIAFTALQSDRARSAERRLTEVYASALYESMEDLQSLSLSLEKLIVSTDAAHQASLLCDIAGTAASVHHSLTALPLSHDAMSDTLAYMNRLADYAQSLNQSLLHTGALGENTLPQLESHRIACTQLSAHLSLAAQEAASADSPSVLRAFASDVSAADRPVERVSAPDVGMRYPAFQDTSAQPVTPKGLTGPDVTQDEVLAIARDFVGTDRTLSVSAAPDTGGSIPAYGVTVHTADVQLNLEVTRQGGHILWMIPETASFSELLTPAVCAENAIRFLTGHGFSEPQQTSLQTYNGLCVIHFAPMQDGVILYPDTFKVQVRMDTGDIVGFDAHDYLLNHTLRILSEPQLSENDARALLSAHVSASEGRLCLLPDGSTERLCWEFPIRYGDAQYIIYLDAATGAEIAVRKIIPTETGSIAA